MLRLVVLLVVPHYLTLTLYTHELPGKLGTYLWIFGLTTYLPMNLKKLPGSTRAHHWHLQSSMRHTVSYHMIIARRHYELL